ncbi:MAG TPA: 23S rRNA (guanosine(2251)-2'-O)-methyltransferase RlmB [Acidimicrobiales bacterium]|nr:23S rRNA (guanosine(2251)-2'-O)-methyltransferase RlmB [Acidimicrobiales bacterium]
MLRHRPPRALNPPGRPRPEREEDLGGVQVEGLWAVRELLRAGRRVVREVAVAAGRSETAPLDEILELARLRRVPVRRLTPEELQARAQSEVPQGVIARAEPLRAVPLADLASAGADGRPPFLLVFDELTDPQNFGAALRSALSAGATGAVVARQRAARVTPSVAKAAAGAVEHLPIALVGGIAAALGTLSRHGVWSVALDGEGERVLDEVELLAEPVALVVGAEGRGLAPLVRQRCDVRARIPLLGPLESLNAAAAAAVACFTVARARRGVPTP